MVLNKNQAGAQLTLNFNATPDPSTPIPDDPNQTDPSQALSTEPTAPPNGEQLRTTKYASVRRLSSSLGLTLETVALRLLKQAADEEN